MRHFTGVCRGGPYDGKMLEHSRKDFRVVVVPPLSFRQTYDPDEDVTRTLKFGIYHHVAEQWVWRLEE